MNLTTPDRWDSGSAYEAYVGRWSAKVARAFVPWLQIPPGACWLDVGCGTGALMATILELAAPRQITGVDFSFPFIAAARERVRGEPAAFAVSDAQALPVSDGFDAAVSGLALNFIPQPAVALAEMVRAVRSGGVVAVYVWDYAGGIEMMRYFWDAVVALAPEAISVDEGVRFPLCRPGPLQELFESVSLRDIAVREIRIDTPFRNWEDYWNPFLGGTGTAPSYLLSLRPERREALRERIRQALPFAADGSIHLTARAWAARALVP